MCVCISECCDKVFGSIIIFSDMYVKTHGVYFDNQGVPFITQKNIDCHHGVDRQLVAKESVKKIKATKGIKVVEHLIELLLLI